MECQNCLVLGSAAPNRQAGAVHFGRLEDRNSPRIRRPFLSWGLAAINPTEPTPISPRISNAIRRSLVQSMYSVLEPVKRANKNS